MAAPEKNEKALSVRRGCRTAIVAAACWIVLGVDSILRPRPLNYRDALWMLPFAFTVATFWFIHQVQRSRFTRLEPIGFYAVMAASVLAFLGNIGVQLNQPTLAVLAFPWGAVLWTIGLILFGIGTLKSDTLPGYVGTALILLEPGSILTGLALSPISPLHDRGTYSGGIEKGAVLALIAFGFQRLSKRPLEISGTSVS